MKTVSGSITALMCDVYWCVQCCVIQTLPASLPVLSAADCPANQPHNQQKRRLTTTHRGV